MALISAKAAAKIASLVVPKDIQEKSNQVVITLLLGVIFLPVILILVLFSGNTAEKPDSYKLAFNAIGCDQEYLYQLEDVRFFDSYTRAEQFSETDLSADDIKARLEQDYFLIKNKESTNVSINNKKVCLLKSDEEIIETLKNKYNVSSSLHDEIIETVEMIRNGRQNFIMPISGKSILTDYELSSGHEGITFSVDTNEAIQAISEGVITLIQTDSTTYPTLENDKDLNVSKGLTLLIEHEVQRGMKDDGEYHTTKMYSYYTNLKDVSLNVGDTVKQGQEIGTTAKKYFHFQLWNAEKSVVNPNDYMFISSGKFANPLDEPFALTSPVGDRDLGYHYGTDFAKDYGASIYSITDGEVIEVNSTCNPNPSKPSKCPQSGSVQWGGNYVVIKAKVDGTTYYIQYAHMKQINASVGQKVYAGQCIGFQGNSGNSYGSHVHIEAHTGGINTAQKDSVFDVNEWLQLSS